MSTFENKKAVVREFLVNRAGLRRVTNFEEISRVAGRLLYERGERSISSPVRREKIADVLVALDDESLAEKGYLLSALVTHFWDNNPGHRFVEAARGRGLVDENASDADVAAFHGAQLSAIHKDIAVLHVALQVPDDPSDLDDIDEDFGADADAGV